VIKGQHMFVCTKRTFLRQAGWHRRFFLSQHLLLGWDFLFFEEGSAYYEKGMEGDHLQL